MDNILLTVLVTLNLAFLLGFLRLWRKSKQIEGGLLSFILPRGEGEASPLAEASQVFADMVGRSIAAQLKTTFMGVQSGNVRSEAALEHELKEGVLEQASPVVSALMQSAPGLRKSLKKNPGLMDLVVNTVMNNPNILKGFGGSPSGNHSGEVKFNL